MSQGANNELDTASGSPRRPREHSPWNNKAEGLGGLEVDRDLEFRRLHERQIGGFVPFRISST
jgi:hypothetical protein